MIPQLVKRFQFIWSYKTFKCLVVCPDNPHMILVFHKGQTIQLTRLCPHQGAPLETGHIKQNKLICPWHGCQFSLLDGVRCKRSPYVVD